MSDCAAAMQQTRQLKKNVHRQADDRSERKNMCGTPGCHPTDEPAGVNN